MFKTAKRGNLSLSKLQSPITTRWLNDNYYIEDGVSLPRSSLYTHYLDFCTKNTIVPVNAASFGKIIRSTFPNLKTRRLGTRGQSKYHYYGIAVRRTSPYYEMVMLEQQENAKLAAEAAAAAALAAAENAQGKEDAPPKKRAKNTSPSSSNKSSNSTTNNQKPNQGTANKMTSPSSTSHNTLKEVEKNLPPSSMLLPEFPSYKVVEIDDDKLRDKVKTFLIMYKAHCQRILDTILRANFSEVQNFLVHFWQGIPAHILIILHEESVVDLIGQCDTILYKSTSGVLIPNILQPIPTSLTQAIQQFAKDIYLWLEVALFHLPEQLQRKKLLVSKSFAQQLVRQTSLSHLAQAARTVLTNTEVVAQMALDFQEIPSEYLIKQVLWITSNKYHEHDEKVITKFIDEMSLMLEHQASVEEFAGWLSSMVITCVVKPSEQVENSFQTLAQDFLLRWSFITSKIVQELTLRSAKSFGSFHLLQMLFDDYIFYKIESHADISEEIEDVIPDNRTPGFNSRNRGWPSNAMATSPNTSMMYRARVNIPSTARTPPSYPNFSVINYNYPSRAFTFPYDGTTRYANSKYQNVDPLHSLNTAADEANANVAEDPYYADDLELVRQLQERTKSLMDATSRYTTEQSDFESPYSVYNGQSIDTQTVAAMNNTYDAHYSFPV